VFAEIIAAAGYEQSGTIANSGLADLRHRKPFAIEDHGRGRCGVQMYAGQLTVTAEMVRALVDEQCQRCAGPARWLPPPAG
jgi:hypothetical protein